MLLSPPQLHSLLHLKPSISLHSTNHRRRRTRPLPLRLTAAAKGGSGWNPDSSLSSSAIRRIADKLRSLGYIEETPDTITSEPSIGLGSPGEIFIPTPNELPAHRVGHTLDPSWSSPDQPVPSPGAAISRYSHLYRERLRPRAIKSPPAVAELIVPKDELRRLRTEGIKLEKRIKIGKAGVTEGIVNGIHERWRRSELVKVKCEDLCRMNMKQTHEILERKTGGMVIWRSGSTIVLYRGADYKYPYFYKEDGKKVDHIETSLEARTDDEASDMEEGGMMVATAIRSSLKTSNISNNSSLVVGVGSPNKFRLQLPGENELEAEADKLLDGLGPRFTDWWGPDPQPVDADLLPAMVPGFRKPFRLLPFGVKPKLTDREMTILRRLGRPLPCHFALGRNRNLHGLAVSMIKLWERCEIAKVAVKRGVQNTNSEIMVEELKRLTGGTLLSRDKEFIVFYRGKDFLPPAVSVAIEERRNSETAKLKENGRAVSPIVTLPQKGGENTSVEGQPGESRKIGPLPGERKLSSRNLVIDKVDTKLSEAIKRKEKAEKLLADLQRKIEPSVREPDREAISEEERYMLRKVGLRMEPFLLLGRRGVFDGTVENMHLHWKYRELVKIISKDRRLDEVEHAARTLEAESGGILVAVERVRNGYAIILYRGKNYRRPAVLRPKTLLNKKEAMKRCLEAQRYESLKLHILNLSRNIDQLKQKKNSNCESMNQAEITELERSVSATETETGSKSERNEEGSMDFISDKKTFEGSKNVQSTDEEICSTTLPTSSSICDETVNCNEKAEVSALSLLTSSETSCLTNDAASFSSSEQSPNLSINLSQSETGLPSHDVDLKAAALEHQVSLKASPLSNQERLILRKQALRMRKRPVIAVGRSNILTGVAKTILTHFKRYPLAIVNIKGRAKGTSVQEVIFQLEHATGAVLVSREPNKVILYRGWGEGEVPRGVQQKDEKQHIEEAVPHQLMEAIRLECGLQESNFFSSSQ